MGGVTKPVVLIAEELSPATIDALGPDFEVRHVDGADRAALLPAVADVDALLVRSATKVDAEVLAAARNLKVVARAGVGLDNVDVKAATQAGVMVVNAPQSNIVSAAELAVGLLLAAARHIAPATAALKQGEWKRSKYSGVELYEKTAGIVGLGRIGALVAQRLSAFGMNVIAYDPYVAAGRAAQMGVRLVSLDELLRSADVISVHLPKTPETVGLIGADQLATVKPSLILVNAARGGIVDEAALYAALKEGRVAAAGLDVYATEPCTDSPLFELENVVATPHLGASTDEAQEKAGVVGREVGPPRARRRPGARRGQRPGRRHRRGRAPRHPAGREPRPVPHRARRRRCPAQLDIEVRGEITAHDVRVLELAALKGLFLDVVEDPVSYVNAPVLAAERGVQVRLTTDAESPDYRNLVTPARHPRRRHAWCPSSGTLTGTRHVEKIVEIDGFDVEVALSDHMAVFRYEDRPGHRRHRRADARRGQRQHRRHAGQPGPPGRPRAGRDDRRHARSRPASWTTSSARSAPRPRARSTSPTDRVRVIAVPASGTG